MKYIVFSDIHGNQYALKQMLYDTKGLKIDGYIFLGDICGYYYGQNECLDMLKGLKNIYYVRGNHDQYYLDVLNNHREINTLTKLYGKSYLKKLDASNIEFLNQFHQRLQLQINHKKILCVHGGLFNYLEERIYPDGINEYVQANGHSLKQYDYVFTGHTHYSFVANIGKTVWINPGSVGQPRDGLGSRYCIIDFEKGIHEFKNILYNRDLLKAEVVENHETAKNEEYLINVLYRNHKA